MACPGLTAACGQPTAPAPGCTDSWIRRIGSAVPGLMVLHTSLDLRTAPAQGCTNSLVRRVGSAEGITAACGQPGGLWPLVACPPSAPAVKLLRASFVKTNESGRRETSEAKHYELVPGGAAPTRPGFVYCTSRAAAPTRPRGEPGWQRDS